MSKKKIKLAYGAVIIIAILIACMIVIRLIQVRKNEQKENERIELEIKSRDAEALLRYMSADGEVIIQDGKVVITDLEFKECMLIMSICYYNEKTGSAITMEQLIEQFYVYIINYEFDESTEELEDFCSYVKQEGAYMAGASRDYLNYYEKVSDVLYEQDLDWVTVTLDQLEAVCKKALEELGY